MSKALEVFIKSKNALLTNDIVIGVLASFLVVLSAPFTLPLPFSPVPITLQVHVILFLSALLGRRRALIMVLSFLGQGMMGMPVFAGGAFGIANFIGPRGGYLLGYLIAANLVGTLQEKAPRKLLSVFSNMALGNLVIYACGVLWLQQFTGWMGAIYYGVLPFVIGDFIKLLFFSKLFPTFLGKEMYLQ